MTEEKKETGKIPADTAKTNPADTAASAPVSKPSMLVRGRRLIAPALNARLVAVGAAGLALGTVLGVLSAPRDRSSEALAGMRAEILETRAEIRLLSEATQRSDGGVASLREGLADAKAAIDRQDAAGSERIGNVEKAVALGFADAKARRERDEQELASRLSTVVSAIDRMASLSSSASKAKPEPDTTGAIPVAKATAPNPAGEWALREVLDGVAVIEDRKRRIIEVSRGDVVPGLGRVEAVERRARTWAVVTKQGDIVPQGW